MIRCYASLLVLAILSQAWALDLPDPLISHYPEYGVVYTAQDLPYARINGPLIHDGIRVTDIQQGRFSDCYWIAAVASIAHARPDFLKQIIWPNADGSYSGVLFEPTATSRGIILTQRNPITVDADFPVFATDAIAHPFRQGKLSYARTPEIAPNTYELWPLLLEKIFAIRQSRWSGLEYPSYATIHQNNYTGDITTALITLTGQAPKRGPVRGVTVKQMRDHLRRYPPDKHPTSVLTLRNDAFYEGSEIRPDHNYVVLGVLELPNNDFSVTLYNPWGYHEPDEPWAGDGIFPMRAQEFLHYFYEIVWLE